MKNMIFFVALPFILGCTATAQTTPSKQPKTNRVETFSQLDSTEPAKRPEWLQVVPESDEGFYFVGMSTKRTEKRNARNESFNDALIGFARYCGLNVQYFSEHRDKSIGGNGGLIDTFTNGNTISKMQAEMLLGNVAVKDRYTEKYSNFYGGSFMGHVFVDSTLIYVPKAEMNLCRENRKQANTALTLKTNEIKQLEAKNELLGNQLVIEKQNTSVALAQAQQSSEFFKQVLNKPVVKKIEKPIAIVKKIEKPIVVKKARRTNKLCNRRPCKIDWNKTLVKPIVEKKLNILQKVAKKPKENPEKAIYEEKYNKNGFLIGKEFGVDYEFVYVCQGSCGGLAGNMKYVRWLK
jgi:hypothetical protein